MGASPRTEHQSEAHLGLPVDPELAMHPKLVGSRYLHHRRQRSTRAVGKRACARAGRVITNAGILPTERRDRHRLTGTPAGEAYVGSEVVMAMCAPDY